MKDVDQMKIKQNESVELTNLESSQKEIKNQGTTIQKQKKLFSETSTSSRNKK